MIFKYFRDKKLRKEKIVGDIKVRVEKLEQIRIQEKNRIELIVPEGYIRNILQAYDIFIDSKNNVYENRYSLWLQIEEALPETKIDNWFVSILGSNFITIRQILHPPGDSGQYSDYIDARWSSTRKKMGHINYLK